MKAADPKQLTIVYTKYLTLPNQPASNHVKVDPRFPRITSGMDEERILSYYADNVVLQIPGTLMEGKDALRDQFVRPFITAFPGNRHLVKNMIFASGVAIVEFDFQAQHQGPFAGHAATGARINVPGCGVYEYDSVKRQITAARIYFDVGTLLQTITDLPFPIKRADLGLRAGNR